MRNALFSLLVATGMITAADPETITMKDGRTIIGEVTPVGAHLAKVALVKPKGAVVQIDLDEVKERAEYIPQPEPVKSVVAVANPAQPAERAPETQDPFAEKRAKISDLRTTLAKLDEAKKIIEDRTLSTRSAISEIRRGFDRDFAMNGDLSMVPVELPPNANAEQQARAKRAIELNQALTDLQKRRESLKKSPGEYPGDVGLLNAWFWKNYCEFKGVKAPYADD